ncbi:MAG: 16S rRNA (adenine(1518)-N(6)/adenine(1519)-N(6)) -dimethyltransferase RsmA [Acidobacteriaceae bacterium]
MSRKIKPKLGQNFLVDDRARHAIADALGDLSGRTVIEIGPGHGAITEILAARAAHLIAVELDPSFVAELNFRFRNATNVTIHHADILETDLRSLLPASLSGDTLNGSEPAFDVIGNLPYYITSDILLKLFATAAETSSGVAGEPSPAHLRRAVLMMQREVADRVSASPGVRDYGMLSATTRMYADVQNLFTLPPSAFNPPPDVFSTVLRLEFAPRFDELKVDPPGFSRFLRICFAQKRKTLANNLRSGGFAEQAVRQAWPASISPLARAETITLEGMAELYRALNLR